MSESENTLDRSLAKLSELAPSQAVSLRIRTQCRPDRAVRGLSAKQRVLATLVALLCGGALCLTSLRQMQHIEHSDWARRGLLAPASWSLAFATVLFAGLYQPPLRRASRLTRRVLLAFVLSALFAYLASLATGFAPLAEQLSAANFSALLRCGSSAALGGALIALGTMALWRRTDPFDPGVTGALLGLMGGLAAALALGEVCSNHEAWHLWLGHGLAVLLVTSLSALIGRRWLSP